MRLRNILAVLATAPEFFAAAVDSQQALPSRSDPADRNVSMALFSELEELSRLVDISYCTGMLATGISKPFHCWCRCGDFPHFQLVKDWRTGFNMQSDSGGYVAVDSVGKRIVIAFRGTYNIAGWLANLSLSPQEYVPFPGAEDQIDGTVESGRVNKVRKQVEACSGCTVHTGFEKVWNNTRPHIIDAVREQVELHPDYDLHLTGHSLGAAVAAFAALDFNARGWSPIITTWGEPRIGNGPTNRHIDEVFGLDPNGSLTKEEKESRRWRRITRVNDPIPLVPPTEWGFAMHSGEIHITKPSLSPDLHHIEHCDGAFDKRCIAGQDPTYPDELGTSLLKKRGVKGALVGTIPQLVKSILKRDVPLRFNIWQMFIAHRDYFWRLGLCIPGGDPTGGGGHFPELEAWREKRGIESGAGPVGEVWSGVKQEIKDEL